MLLLSSTDHQLLPLVIDPPEKLILAGRAKVGLEQECRVPESEARQEDGQEREVLVIGVRCPDHVEASQEDAYKEGHERGQGCADDGRVVRQVDRFNNEDCDHKGRGEADLVGYEPDDSFPCVLLGEDVHMYQLIHPNG